ncbi:hypothetical protein Y1Q_0005238 [Alligator mississippiensis]|uniref:Uncharacterized protein n=1 Tax=Alligator mississippiensis TaxID=8496 RepID=A0A151MT43_ALLMI|nr:hypothetical protein Y1Q_0005238 [Alligator mississippiensis]
MAMPEEPGQQPQHSSEWPSSTFLQCMLLEGLLEFIGSGGRRVQKARKMWKLQICHEQSSCGCGLQCMAKFQAQCMKEWDKSYCDPWPPGIDPCLKYSRALQRFLQQAVTVS